MGTNLVGVEWQLSCRVWGGTLAAAACDETKIGIFKARRLTAVLIILVVFRSIAGSGGY